MKVKKELVARKTYLLTFENQREMTQTLLRFQEHYESPYFAGQAFSLKEYKTWYRKSRDHGQFTYYTDWAGFNFPSSALKAFYSGKFKNITKRERKVLDLFKDTEGEYYVIGVDCVDGEESVALAHELCHAMYYVVKPYREKIQKVLKNNANKLSDLYVWLMEEGYSGKPYILMDEANAFMACDNDLLYNEDVEFPEQLSHKLYDLKERYFKKYMGVRR